MKSVRSMIRAPVRMDQATDGRSGCSRQGAARQAANNRGAVRQVRFYDFTPAGTNSGRFPAACAAVPFRRYGCRARKPYASPLAAGERRPRKCRVNAAMIPGMISAMTPAMMAHAVMPAPGVSAGSPAGDYIPPPPCAPPVLPPPPPCAPLLMSSLRIDLAVRFTPTFCLPKR
mgnify:CR=1 FL=1